jgi:cytochrome c-type protein NapC
LATSPRKIKIGVAVLVLTPTLVFASWVLTETMVEKTGDEPFCGGCHTMSPMVEAYRADVHGGAGGQGVKAKCTQCHIPHDNPVDYMIMKSRFGIHDAWAQMTYDLDEIDWQAKRGHSEDYVFDSGCLQCHKDLQRASESSAVSFVAHRPYFQGTIESKCVTCHNRVGHKNLSEQLARVSEGK